ncbi:MAG: type VI secretion system baseplate subunit TssG [Alphaproteobacteria bacterium]|nr:type VI secretion system baseplate subunit TssG [Alphaproteobacteria bacterium]
MADIGKYIKVVSRKLKQGISEPDFFELVRRFEQNYKDLPRIGCAKRPTQEKIRFGQAPFLNFPANNISEIRTDKGYCDAIIMTYFFGLLGVNGPMPLEFTNYVFQRSHNFYDQTWRRFLDIIHHRMITLFYYAWAKNEQAVSFDRKDDDLITTIIKSLAGVSSKNEDVNDDLYYLSAGNCNFFGSFIKSKTGLEQVLRGFFHSDIRVKEFVPFMYPIPEQHRCKLGNFETSILGNNIQIGRSYMTISKKFKIFIGPCDFNFSKDFMPGFKKFELLIRIINKYLSRPYDYDIDLEINSKTLPKAKLGDVNASTLGYNCWLGKIDTNKNVNLNIDAGRIALKQHMASIKHKRSMKWAS